MKRKNGISALLAIVMVISMMTCFAMPAAAEGPSQEELDAMTPASKATADDTVTAYKIDSVDELIKAASNITVSSQVIQQYKDGEVIYLTTDLDIAKWEAETGRDFAKEYIGWNKHTKYYNEPHFTFDGLNHTIRNYHDTEAFFSGNHSGIVRNVIFDNAQVDVVASSAGASYHASAIVCRSTGGSDGGVALDNVHVINSHLKSYATGSVGALVAWSTSANRNISITNCSVINTVVETTATTASSNIGLFVGKFETNALTIKNCVAAGSTLIVPCASASGVGNALLVGNINPGDKAFAGTFDNIAVVDCTYLNSTRGLDAMVACFDNMKAATSVAIDRIYAANNVYVNGSAETPLAQQSGVPMEHLFCDVSNLIGGTSSTAAALAVLNIGSSIQTDAGVKNVLYAAAPTSYVKRPTISNTNGLDGYNTGAAVAALNNATDETYINWAFDVNNNLIPYDGETLPVAVRFGAVDFVTNMVGKLVLDEWDLAYLKSTNWVSGDTVYAAGYDWSNERYAATATYTAKAEAPFYVTFDKNYYAPGDVITATVGLKAGANLAAANMILSSNSDVVNLQEGSFNWVAENAMTVEPRPVDGALEIAFSENTGNNITAATDLFTVTLAARGPMSESAEAYVMLEVKIAGTETGSGLSDIVNSYQIATVKKYAPVKAEAKPADPDVDSLPSVMTAFKDDGVRAYKISTLEELVWAASADRYAEGYYKFAEETGAFKGSSYGNPCFIESSIADRSDYSTLDTIYLTEDLDIADYPGGAEAFAADFDNFNKHASFWATMFVNFNGMGHTITGFNDTNCFAAYWVGEFKNVTFVNPTVTSTLAYDAIILHGVEEGGVIMENVHVIGGTLSNSHYNSTDEYSAVGGILVGMVSNGNRCLKVYDCSVINSTINATADNAQYMGLVAGLIASPASGYPSDCVTLDNVIVQGCTINAKNLGNYNSMLLGRVDKSSGTLGLYLNNVAVFDCHVISETDSDVGATFAAVANVYRISASAATDVGSVYVGNVTGKSGTAAAAPLTSLIYDQGSVFSAEATVKDGNYYTDGTITTVSNKQTIAVNSVDGLTLDKAIGMMEGGWYVENGNRVPLGHKITFNRIDPDATTNTYAGTYEFYTDPNTGRLAYQPNGQKITTQQWAIITAGWMPAADSTERYLNGELESMVFEGEASVYEMPLASRATASDTVTAYQINSIEELLAADALAYTSTSRTLGFWKKGETIYITADLDIAEWNALHYETSFAEEYYGFFRVNNTTNTYYTDLNCNIDGLNHTINGYEDTHPFIQDCYNATISNLIFTNAYVCADLEIGEALVGKSGAILMRSTEDGVIIDNVHIIDSEYRSVKNSTQQYVGLFVAMNNNGGAVKDVTIRNCSAVRSDVIMDAKVTASVNNLGIYMGLSGGASTVMQNCIAVGCSIKGTSLASSEGGGLLVGYTYSNADEENKYLEYHNIGVVDCSIEFNNANGKNLAVLTRNKDSKDTAPVIDHIYSVGNTYTYVDSTSGESLTSAIPYLVSDVSGSVLSSVEALQSADYVTDAGVTHAVNDEADSTLSIEIAAENKTLSNVNQVLELLNKNAVTTKDYSTASWYVAPQYAEWYIVNNCYRPVHAVNAEKGTVYRYGLNNLSYALNYAFPGQTVEMVMDLAEDEIVVNAGVTLDLNGYDLTVDTLMADGHVYDNTDGSATLSAETLFLAENNKQMSLVDGEVYRLFDYTVESAGKKEDTENHQVKFGYRVNFANADAYALLDSNAAGDLVTFKVTLTCDGLGEPINYVFPAEMVTRYVTYKQNGSSPAFTLLVRGLDTVAENTKVVTVPTLISTTGVAGVGAENYCL